MKTITKKIINLLIIAVFCLQMAGPASIAYAADPTPPATPPAGDQGAGDKQITPTTVNVGNYLLTSEQKKQPTSIGAYIVRVINFLSLLIGSFGVLAVIIGGFFLVIASGREEMITRGKDIIKMAIIGIVVAVSAYWLVAAMQSLFY